MIKIYANFLYFHLLFLLFFLYTIVDFKTSQNSGALVVNLVDTVDRIFVYIILSLILFLLGLFFLKNKLNTVRTGVFSAFLFIFLWIMIINIFKAINMWSSMVEIGLSAIWWLQYFFFKENLQQKNNILNLVKIYITILFWFQLIIYYNAFISFNSVYGKNVPLNAVYNVLVFCPWLWWLTKNKIVRWCYLIIVSLVVFISMKRGAIVVFPLMLCIGMLVEAAIKKKFFKYSIAMFFMAIAVIFVFNFIDHFFEYKVSERFELEKISEASGRIDMYNTLIDHISNRTSNDLIFGVGSGYNYTLLDGKGAHNEWLEFFSSFGLVGVALYGYLFFCLLSRFTQLVKKQSPYAPSFAMAVVYMFVTGLWGQIYFTHTSLWIISFLGSIDGVDSKDAVFCGKKIKKD